MTSSPVDRSYVSKAANDVEAKAKAEVSRLGSNVSDRSALLGQFKVQFGRFKGKTFKWLLENGLGYSAWLVNNMSGETLTSALLSVNKHFFKEYLTSFDEGKEALALKKAEKEGKQTVPGPSLQSLSLRKSNTTAALLSTGEHYPLKSSPNDLKKSLDSLEKYSLM